MAITINGTTGIAGVDGSASTPAVQGADPNTGIFYPAADTIAFAEGGTEVMRIDSSGNVGIGTSSPDSRLMLTTPSGTACQLNLSQTAVTNFRLSIPASTDALAFVYGASTERARIDSSGNLLVNTTTAQTGAKLAVTGGIQGIITSGTAVVNPTSPASSSIDFTGIPSWVKRITVMFSEASLSSTADILIRLGDAGGIEDTGYISTSATAAANSSSTTGFVIRVAAAANALSGIATIQNVTGNSWVCSHSTKVATTATPCGGGSKTLSDTLTQIRITTTSTDTFDAGTVNIYYEG